MLKPIYEAVFKMDAKYSILVYFSSPLPSEVVEEIRTELKKYEIDFAQVIGMQGKPWNIGLNPTYSATDVAREVEKLLRKHGFKSFLFDLSPLEKYTTLIELED